MKRFCYEFMISTGTYCIIIHCAERGVVVHWKCAALSTCALFRWTQNRCQSHQIAGTHFDYIIARSDRKSWFSKVYLAARRWTIKKRKRRRRSKRRRRTKSRKLCAIFHVVIWCNNTIKLMSV